MYLILHEFNTFSKYLYETSLENVTE